MMNNFYQDALQFDSALSLWDSEKNSILATGLNQRNITPLAQWVMWQLIGDIRSDKANWINDHADEIFLLHALFSFWRTIHEKNTVDWNNSDNISAKPLRSIKLILSSMIEEAWLKRREKNILTDILSDRTGLSLSSAMISRFQELDKRRPKNTKPDTNEISTLVTPWWYDRLVYLRCQVVSRYLMRLKWVSILPETSGEVTKLLAI